MEKVTNTMPNIGLKRLESQIRFIISETLQKKLSDPRLDQVASITRVELTADMSFADVHFSVMGTGKEQKNFIHGMSHAHGLLQRRVAKKLRTRTCPVLRFHLDQSIKKGFETLRILDKTMEELSQRQKEETE